MNNSKEKIMNVVVPLSNRKRRLVTLGCICLMLSIACFGLSLSVIQGPILEEENLQHYLVQYNSPVQY